MQTNFAVNHVALALANLCHVGRDGTGRRAELRRVMRQICDPRAPRNLILAAQAGDVGTGSPRSTASLPPCSCCKVLTVKLRSQFSPYFGQSLVLRRVQKVGVRSLLPQIEELKSNKTKNQMKPTKTLIAGAAVAGLMAGSLPVRAYAANAPTQAGVSLQTMAEKGVHACKGQNVCKGQGGCKTSDAGCKAKTPAKAKAVAPLTAASTNNLTGNSWRGRVSIPGSRISNALPIPSTVRPTLESASTCASLVIATSEKKDDGGLVARSSLKFSWSMADARLRCSTPCWNNPASYSTEVPFTLAQRLGKRRRALYARSTAMPTHLPRHG